MDRQFTSLQSLVRGFARAMNLVSPEVHEHHEKVAYLSYRLAEEMGLEERYLQAAVYGALLHDVGVVVMGDNTALSSVESRANAVAQIGASILKSSSPTKALSDIVKHSQLPGKVAGLLPGLGPKPVLIGQVIHLADLVSLAFAEDAPVLNQLDSARRDVLEAPDCLFLPSVVEAFERLCKNEYVWMDMLYRPGLFIDFVPTSKVVTLDEAVIYARFMSMIIDYRSPFTAMHSAGVAASAEYLANLAGMSNDECKMMRIAGSLHDVGKLRVPAAILEKPGKLTDEEFNIVKEHAYYTYVLLKDIEGFEQICTWAAYHHEKLSGSGYPFKLSEPQIPFGARIMAVADVFSAVTEDRPYRKGMPKEKVVEILRENAQRGDLSSPVVELLVANYDDVDAARDAESHEAGARYYASIEADA